MRGVEHLSNGDESGWLDVDASILYTFWLVKTRADYDSSLGYANLLIGDGLGLDLQMSRIASVLCYAILHEVDPWRREMMAILNAVEYASTACNDEFWRERRFEPFAMQLHCRDTGDEMSEGLSMHDLGVYGNVFSCWDDPSALADALVRVCDYHCEHMQDTGSEHDEFKHPPFDLYPVEVLAIYAVRDRLGLETPEIEHPLLDTPLASRAPREIVPHESEALRLVQRIYRNYFGEDSIPPELNPL